MLDEAPRSLPASGVLEALAIGLSRTLALALTCAAGRLTAPEAHDVLDEALADLRSRLAEGAPASLKPHLDA